MARRHGTGVRTGYVRTETRTIQVWPGGQSYTFRGDPEGPAGRRSLLDDPYYRKTERCPDYCHRFYADDTTDDNDPRIGKYCAPLAGAPEGSGPEVCKTCTGTGYVPNPKPAPRWRKGTAAEWRAIRIELAAERIWDQNGRGCDSALVDDLLKVAAEGGRSDLAEGFGYDKIRNLYADPSDWDAAQCREYASDQGIELPDVPTVAKRVDRDPDTPEEIACAKCGELTPARWAHGASHTCEDCAEQVPEDGYEDDDSRHGWLTEAREACRDHAQDNPAEVYEWWRVTDWLCEQLHAIGEVTIDNGYGSWWGRTCTGQGLIMDGTLQQVAARFVEEG